MSEDLPNKELMRPTTAVPPTSGKRLAAALSSVAHRLDPSHTAPLSELPPKDSPPAAPMPRTEADEERLLLQAQQIAEHLRKKYGELDRRDQRLTVQLSELDDERRTIRLWKAEIESALDQQASDLERRVALADAREERLDQAEQAVQEERLELLRQQSIMEAEQRSLQAELQRGWDEVAAARVQLAQQAQERELAWQKDREARLSELAAELAQRQEEQEFVWEREREEIAAERAALAAEATHVRAELAAEREQNSAELEILRNQFEVDCIREQAIWSAACAVEQQELTQRRDACESECIALRTVTEQSCQEQRTELERDQAAFEADQKRRRAELDQERILLDARARFHEEYLRKTRDELETAQTEFQVEVQTSRNWLAERERQFWLHRQQLLRYAALLSEREAALERAAVLRRENQEIAAEQWAEQQAVAAAQWDAWQTERDRQLAEVRRQQELVTLHAENLEARRQRLDKLRAELEETHHETLALRVAVEEASAQLAQAAGSGTARERIDQARHALSEHFRSARETLVRQRQDLEQAQLRLHQQRDEFQAERQTLAEWMSQRDQQLRDQEAALRVARGDEAEREQAWRAVRENWQREKGEAEAVIRDLLRRLDEALQPSGVWWKT